MSSLDPPVGVSNGLPHTTGLGFQTGHPDSRVLVCFASCVRSSSLGNHVGRRSKYVEVSSVEPVWSWSRAFQTWPRKGLQVGREVLGGRAHLGQRRQVRTTGVGGRGVAEWVVLDSKKARICSMSFVGRLAQRLSLPVLARCSSWPVHTIHTIWASS